MSNKNNKGRPKIEGCITSTGKKFLLLLTKEQYDKIESLSQILSQSKANLIREAVDKFLMVEK